MYSDTKALFQVSVGDKMQHMNSCGEVVYFNGINYISSLENGIDLVENNILFLFITQ